MKDFCKEIAAYNQAGINLRAEVLSYFGVKECDYGRTDLNDPYCGYGELILRDCVELEVKERDRGTGTQFYVECWTGQFLANGEKYVQHIGHEVYQRGGQTMAIQYDDCNHTDNIYLLRKVKND
jgi:hypothetical protein